MHRIILICIFLTLQIALCNSLFAEDVRVEDLDFKGNKQLSSGKLERAIRTQANPWYRLFIPWMDSQIFDEDEFFTDLLRVEQFYHQEGYLQAKVTEYELNYNENKDEVNIIIYVDEGEPTRIDHVFFQFKADSSRGLYPERMPRSMKLKTGKRYREVDLKLDYEKIINLFNNNGYPYIEARVRPTWDHEQHLVNLEWLLKPGPFCKFGKIIYSGNKSVSDKAIRRGLGFSTGDIFVQKKLASAQSQVYRLELFQFVSLRATNLDSRPTNIPIEVRMKEASLRTLKFGLGYGTEESFRGFAQWRHRNFLGGARILRLNAKRSARLLPLEITAELSQPYFLSNRNDLILKPFFKWIDEESFEERSIGAELTLNRRLTSNTNAFITTIIERDTVLAKGEVSEGSSKSKSLFRIGATHNSADQLFSPTRGRRTTVLLEEAGRFVNSPSKFVKIYAQQRYYKKFNKKNIFALKIAMGLMAATRGADKTPREDRFFAGGNYSVRGWQRQALGPADSTNSDIPLGGDSIIEGSLEIRRNLFKKFSGAVFLDFGNVWPKWDDFNFFDLKFAAGFGLRYNTLIGPVRIDLGWKLNKQPRDSRGFEWHLSIGQAF